MSPSDPATPLTPDTTSAPEEVPYIRGGVGVINRRAVVRGLLGVLALTLVVLGIVLGVEAINHDGRINQLKHHGIAVTATVTSCYGVAGGTGITEAGFVCRGQFSLGGTSYTETIGGSSNDLAVGQQVAAVVEAGHPHTLTAASTVAASHSSPKHLIYPIVLFVIGVLLGAYFVVYSRRTLPATVTQASGAAQSRTPAPAVTATKSSVATGAEPDHDATRASYDAVAADYLTNIGGELADKPLDRALLTAVLEMSDPDLGVGDLGCGPGHIAAWCAAQGRTTVGIDLSPEMVSLGQRTFPAVEFRVGDLVALPAADGEFGAVIAAYSLIHLTPAELPTAAAEIARVLSAGGNALVAFHLGTDVIHRSDWWGHPVNVDFRYLQSDVIAGHLEQAGLLVTTRLERAPHSTEIDTRRGYLIARKP